MPEQQTVFNKIRGFKDIVLNNSKECAQVDEATRSITNSRQTLEELLKKNTPIQDNGN